MKTKTELRSRLTGALAVLGLLAGGLVFAGTASATTEISEYEQVCYDAWDDAPASDYCTNGSILRHGDVEGASNRGKCFITGIACSVSATNQAKETVTWEASGDIMKSPSDTGTLDVCFAAQRNSEGDTTGYTAALKTGCATDETTSDNMEGSTLPY